MHTCWRARRILRSTYQVYLPELCRIQHLCVLVCRWGELRPWASGIAEVNYIRKSSDTQLHVYDVHKRPRVTREGTNATLSHMHSSTQEWAIIVVRTGKIQHRGAALWHGAQSTCSCTTFGGHSTVRCIHLKIHLLARPMPPYEYKRYYRSA